MQLQRQVERLGDRLISNVVVPEMSVSAGLSIVSSYVGPIPPLMHVSHILR